MSLDYVQPGVLDIDLAALARNYRLLCREAGTSEVAAVVKANAYGLGVAPVTVRLAESGCRTFCVATVNEGIELRTSLPQAAILVFDGMAGARTQSLLEYQLTPVLNTLEDIERWVVTECGAAVHVDTGMSRLGLSTAEVNALTRRRDVMDRLQIDYLMTHLACADRPEHPLNAQQLTLFESIKRALPSAKTSIGNSAGALLGADFCGDMVRAGIALYGGNPFTDRSSPVERVASLRARVLQIRTLEASLPVGYGATYVAGQGDRLAVVGVGYADGYPRRMSNRGFGSINGVRVPVVGRVSMDSLVLDVSSLAVGDVAVGQYVELFGDDISVDALADACGTIGYEILTGLSARLERVYRH